MADLLPVCTLVGTKKNKSASPERFVICLLTLANLKNIFLGFLCFYWSLEKFTLKTSVLFTFLRMEILITVLLWWIGWFVVNWILTELDFQKTEGKDENLFTFSAI